MKIKHKKTLIITLTAVLILMSGCNKESKSNDEQSAAGGSSGSESLAEVSSAASLSVSSEDSQSSEIEITPIPLPEDWTKEDDLAAIKIAINDAAYQDSINNIGDLLEEDVTVGSVKCYNATSLDVRFSTDSTSFYYVLAFDELDKMTEEPVLVRNAFGKNRSGANTEGQESDRHYKASEVFEPFPEHISRNEAEEIALSDAGLDPKERIRIRNFISEIAGDKIVLISTHVVSDIEFIAKEIILLSGGKARFKRYRIKSYKDTGR